MKNRHSNEKMMLTATDPLLQRRLQVRTRLVVEVFDGESYGHDYGSYGHESGDILWWYESGTIYTDNPLTIHNHILGDTLENDSDDDDDDYTITAEDYVRGRYSPVNETISLIPALADDSFSLDYNIPREVFEALELEFPEATTIEVF